MPNFPFFSQLHYHYQLCCFWSVVLPLFPACVFWLPPYFPLYSSERLFFITSCFFSGAHWSLLVLFVNPGIACFCVAFGNSITFFQSLVELPFFSRFMLFRHKLKNCSWIHSEFSKSHFQTQLLIYIILNPLSVILFWFSCISDSQSHLILKLFLLNPSYLRLQEILLTFGTW